MSTEKEKKLYRVLFGSQGRVYELYVRRVAPSDLYGFVEIEELVFGERSAVLVDPAEEKLREEFCNVRRSFVPMHAMIRIDEVDKGGTSKMRDSASAGRVHPFPSVVPPPRED